MNLHAPPTPPYFLTALYHSCMHYRPRPQPHFQTALLFLFFYNPSTASFLFFFLIVISWIWPICGVSHRNVM